jgi:FixJ family two-component response regulator
LKEGAIEFLPEPFSDEEPFDAIHVALAPGSQAESNPGRIGGFAELERAVDGS